MSIPHVTVETFEQEVLQSSLPVLVEFTAQWCAPCRQLEPILEELAKAWEGRIKVVAFDVDQAANNTRFMLKYRILGVPTLLLFVEGKVRERMTGFRPKGALVKKFGRYAEKTTV